MSQLEKQQPQQDRVGVGYAQVTETQYIEVEWDIHERTGWIKIKTDLNRTQQPGIPKR